MSEPTAAAKARVLALQPIELDTDSVVKLDAVAGLYHSVLPNLPQPYLRKYMRRKGVHTTILMLPTPTRDQDDDDDDDDDDNGDEDEDESDEDEAGDDEEGRPEPTDEAHYAAVATLRRRLVGAISYELGQRLGQRLLQVGVLGVRIRFQKCGVGGRLLRPLLQQRWEEALDAAVVFADRRAVPFFKKHGFNDDPMLNARYKEVLEPWERSELMSQQLAPPIPESTGTAHSAWASSEPLEQQLAAWRHARLLEYSKELGLLERLQAEVLSLRGKVARHQQPGEQPGPPCLRTAPHRPPWTI